MFRASSTSGKLHIKPRKDLVVVKKADLLNSKTQRPVSLRNKALLSLDGGGLRGILTGKLCSAQGTGQLHLGCSLRSICGAKQLKMYLFGRTFHHIACPALLLTNKLTRNQHA